MNEELYTKVQTKKKSTPGSDADEIATVQTQSAAE